MVRDLLSTRDRAGVPATQDVATRQQGQAAKEVTVKGGGVTGDAKAGGDGHAQEGFSSPLPPAPRCIGMPGGLFCLDGNGKCPKAECRM